MTSAQNFCGGCGCVIFHDETDQSNLSDPPDLGLHLHRIICLKATAGDEVEIAFDLDGRVGGTHQRFADQDGIRPGI